MYTLDKQGMNQSDTYQDLIYSRLMELLNHSL